MKTRRTARAHGAGEMRAGSWQWCAVHGAARGAMGAVSRRRWRRVRGNTHTTPMSGQPPQGPPQGRVRAACAEACVGPGHGPRGYHPSSPAGPDESKPLPHADLAGRRHGGQQATAGPAPARQVGGRSPPPPPLPPPPPKAVKKGGRQAVRIIHAGKSIDDRDWHRSGRAARA